MSKIEANEAAEAPPTSGGAIPKPSEAGELIGAPVARVAKRSEWWIRAVAALVLTTVAVYVWTHFAISTQMTKFLPTGTDRELSAITAEFTDSSLTRSMILNVKAKDEPATLVATRQLANELTRSGAFRFVESGVEKAAESAFHELYFPRRYLFLSDQPAELTAELSNAGISRKIDKLKQQLSQPSGVFVRALAPRDPWGAFLGRLDVLGEARPSELGVKEGQFLTRDGYGVIFVGFDASAFDSVAQARILGSLDESRKRVEATLGAPLELESAGVNRFALDAETRIKSDVQKVSTLASVGTLALFFLFFPSFGYLLLALIPLAGATLCASAASLAIFGELHAVTIAFGSALLGVCVDYPTHYLNHYSSSDRAHSPWESIAAVRPALGIGAVTTIVGLAGLGWTSFPGFRELALFASVGVTSALVLTLFVLPTVTPQRHDFRFLRWWSARLEQFVAQLGRRRRALWLLPAVALLAIGAAVPRLRWQNSMQELTSQSPSLRQEDERVRARVSATESGRFVLALGETTEEALSNNDRAAIELERAKQDGLLGGFQSLHSFLWSERLQRENEAALVARPELAPNTLAALEAQGFDGAAFRGFLDDAKVAQPLRFADLMSSPLRGMVQSFVAESHGKTAVLSFVRDVRDATALRERLASVPGVHYFDQKQLLDEAYVQFRERTVQLVVAGALAVFGLLFMTYRRTRLTLAAFLPAALGSATALAVIVHSGTPLNLFHVLMSVLVLSMGEDYGVFLVETLRNPELRAHQGSAMAGITLAALSTVLSFGALAFSSEPALRAIGQTAGIGIFACLVLAPIALVLSAPPPEGAAGA